MIYREKARVRMEKEWRESEKGREKIEKIWAWPAGAAKMPASRTDFSRKLRSETGQLELRTGKFEQRTD